MDEDEESGNDLEEEKNQNEHNSIQTLLSTMQRPMWPESN